MIAARQFNEQEGNPQDILYGYGVVTTGTDWKLLKLIGQVAYIDLDDYFIKEVATILGILTATFGHLDATPTLGPLCVDEC